MRGATKPPKGLRPPRFRSEAEEARWWHEHRQELADEFEKAAASGRLGHGSVARGGPTPTTTIRLDRDDIARARALAKRKGLRYQTYLKMLVREALDEEEGAAS
jgi:hypothetical protein